MDGVVNVYKEKDFTSHDVIAILRGVLETKKIGHTGTLDPQAEGVLPVCVGKATKIAGDIMGSTKRYTAELRFGAETDTQDAFGEVLRRFEYEFDERAVREAVQSFMGEYSQIPPMYSAIKKNGIKLYDLARQGVEVEREPRKVTIYGIRILEMSEEGLKIDVQCSKGAYIRTLCEDIGRKLGYGAYMTSLIRTESGPYTLETARTIDQIRSLKNAGRAEEFFIPLESMFLQQEGFTVPSQDDKYLLNGNPLKYPEEEMPPVRPHDLVRMHSSDGTFLGLYKVHYIAKGLVHMRPEKMFT